MGGAIVADVGRNAVTDNSTALWLGWGGGKTMPEPITMTGGMPLCRLADVSRNTVADNSSALWLGWEWVQ